jgi:hypothetical protein
MDQEAEMIREQMQETREALTEKLEALEHQVTDTVQTAATSVAETVETVTDTVKSTVETVKESVEGAVASVGETLNLRLQVQRHPWGMFVGAIAVGFISTRLLERASGGGSGRIMPEVPRAARDAGSSVFGWLASVCREELKSLKALGIGTAAGIVRDMIAQSLPPDLGAHISELADSVTAKAGGRPIHGPILANLTGDGNGHDSMDRGRF